MTQSRKLHQLLPIAREFLITKENPIYSEGDLQEFTCLAARAAVYAMKMSSDECDKLQKAIINEIRAQGGGYNDNTLISLLRDEHNFYIVLPSDPNYFPYRDAWLDEFQKKLELEDR